MSALLALHDAAPWLFHYLDIFAMACTGGSTWLFVARRPRIAYAALILGSILWTGVALLGAFSGRPIYGMLIGSANTFVASVIGLGRATAPQQVVVPRP